VVAVVVVGQIVLLVEIMVQKQMISKLHHHGNQHPVVEVEVEVEMATAEIVVAPAALHPPGPSPKIRTTDPFLVHR